jgi:hypothetical protein
MAKQLGLLGVVSSLVLVCAMKALAQAPPDGPGRQQFVSSCSLCHSIDQILGQRRSRDGWKVLVNKMRSYGAPGKQSDFDAIIDYLSTNLGVGGSPAAPPSLPASNN